MADRCKYQKLQYQVSYDDGTTWENAIPEQVKKGNMIEYMSADCGEIETLYRWVDLQGRYTCVGDKKYTTQIQEESYDGGVSWYTSYPTVYQANEYVGDDPTYCCTKFVGHYVYEGSKVQPIIDCGRGYRWNGEKCVYVDPLKVVKCDGTSTLTHSDTLYYDTYYSIYTLISCEINDTITSIGDYAFSHCSGLTSISIPNSVTSIGYAAFRNCSNLINIDIPTSVTSIDSDAFSGCTSLTSINIPDGVTRIENETFYNCSGLTSCTIGSGVTYIGGSVFRRCSGLTSINIPDGVTTIGYATFARCSSLTSINIPSGVTSIDDCVFSGCTSLTSITIPDSITTIQYSAFTDCSSLTSCTIGSGVTSIKDRAFLGCSSLAAITINAVTPPTLGSSALTLTNSCPIYVPCDSVDAYKSAWSTYRNRIRGIHPCHEPKFSAIYSGGTIYSVECDSNTTLTTGDTHPNGYDFSAMTNAIIGDCIIEIGEKAFSGCSSLTSCTIGDGVTSIGNSAFTRCSGLTTINIPSGVTSIGTGVFRYCTSLTSITIPTGVTSIGAGAISECNSLVSVTVNAVTPPTLGVGNFNNTNSCKIYVPAESVETYKATYPWNYHSYYIQPIP